MKSSLLLFALSVCTFNAWAAQADKNSCSADHFHVNNLVSYAEVREQHLANGSENLVNPGKNGSIKVHGWDKSDVLVRACIQAAAQTEAEARAIAAQVTIATTPGMIQPSGPPTGENTYWGLSYEVWVPNASNLKLEAHNGSISVEAVRGQIGFHTENGSVRLTDVGGNVDGATKNGSLSITLAGAGWSGTGLHVKTTNGSVQLNLPGNFSAQVQASTVNGRIHTDFPVTITGEVSKNLSFTLGSGGPTIEATTVNGSVHIARRA